MLANYFKIALRNLRRTPVHTFINIFGLAVGIACCILIMLFVHNEWSFDRFHGNSDRLYRAWVHEDYGDDEIYFNTVTPLVLAQTLGDQIPEVEQTARLFNFVNLVKRPDRDVSFSETISMVDHSFFTMFDFPLIEGNPESVFDTPNSVVVTGEIADRYFGSDNPLQRILSIHMGDVYEDFVVTGIIRNPPVNSSIRFDMLIPFTNSPKLFGENAHTSWFNVSPETYVLLRDDAAIRDVEPKLISMMHSVLGDIYGEEYHQSDLKYTVGLQPITDIRFDTGFPVGIAAVSNPVYSYILTAIAVLILLIACVNFITLSISRSASRAKEVGIRKTIGAHHGQLMYQFWGESLLITMFAMIAGYGMAELLLPRFNSLSATELTLVLTAETIVFLMGITIFISLAAGIYPSMVLSGFRAVEALRGKSTVIGDRALLRRVMVVFQFTLSIALIAGTLIIGRQLDFIRSKDLGYQKEHVLVVPTDMRPGPGNPLTKVFEDAGRLKNRLQSGMRGHAGIEYLSTSSYTPVQGGGWISADFRQSDGRKREFHFNIVDHDFIETYRIEILQGRNFSAEIASDERRAILVNQALVDDYGWDNPIGQRLPGPDFDDHEIIGVVQNFNFESLHTPVKPLALTINPSILFSGIANIGFSGSPSPRISFRINTDDLPATMKLIENTWDTAADGIPFNYTFVDEAVNAQYMQEERLSQIAAFGSTLAIVIACLGLFGLASLMMVRRTKEIGIRKVLGANVTSIVFLLGTEFLKLVVIGFAISVPIAWYATDRWLENFAYRTEVSVWIFVLAGSMAVITALITVSWQSVRSALANPVEALRYE
jgi:putative ABC transport system permease protein